MISNYGRYRRYEYRNTTTSIHSSTRKEYGTDRLIALALNKNFRKYAEWSEQETPRILVLQSRCGVSSGEMGHVTLHMVKIRWYDLFNMLRGSL